jgi:putative membrane protein
LLAGSGSAQAHGVSGAGWWTLDPWVWVPLLLLVVLYLRGAARRGTGRPRMVTQGGFALALLALGLALIWPLDVLSETSFGAHMAQHMLLIGVAAPLLVFSASARVLFHGLPLARRARKLALPWHLAARPRFAFALHAAAIWIGHAPLVIYWTIEHRWFHILEHAALLGTALLFWSALARSRRNGYGEAALWTLATMLHTGALGALLTFAPRPLYAGYALDDQQLAGLIMWVPMGTVYFGACIFLASRLLGSAERSTRDFARPQ